MKVEEKNVKNVERVADLLSITRSGVVVTVVLYYYFKFESDEKSSHSKNERNFVFRNSNFAHASKTS